MNTEITLLLLAFQIKHWLCDYPLQTTYMLGKFKRVGWVKPLVEHANCHMVFTAIIAFIYLKITGGNTGLIIIVMVLDFVIHFTVDRIKAHPDLGGRFKPDNKYFWWCLGGDQMCHHLTHYFIIYLLVS